MNTTDAAAWTLMAEAHGQHATRHVTEAARVKIEILAKLRARLDTDVYDEVHGLLGTLEDENFNYGRQAAHAAAARQAAEDALEEQ